MKTKKDLAKYLADYAEQELNDFIKAGFTHNSFDYEEVFEQALKAFESTEEIVILPEKQQVIIRLWSGLIDIESRPENIEVILHDYDIDDSYEPDNPDRTYGEDILGIYEETIL